MLWPKVDIPKAERQAKIILEHLNDPDGTAVHQPIKIMEQTKRIVEKDAPLKKDDLIVITGAGGFIAGNLVKYFLKAPIWLRLNMKRCAGCAAKCR